MNSSRDIFGQYMRVVGAPYVFRYQHPDATGCGTRGWWGPINRSVPPRNDVLAVCQGVRGEQVPVQESLIWGQ